VRLQIPSPDLETSRHSVLVVMWGMWWKILRAVMLEQSGENYSLSLSCHNLDMMAV